ncbi:MAG TPA: hypothetical protein VIL46_06870 [Gemmataceae bacterium]
MTTFPDLTKPLYRLLLLAGVLAGCLAAVSPPWPPAGRAAAQPPPAGDGTAHLLRQLALFQSLPPERQEQIRSLHRELHALPPAERDRLLQVLARYADWVEALPPGERRRVTEAPPGQRLEVVRQLREEQWVRAQPEGRRQRLAAAPPQERRELIDRWRREDRQWREEWGWAERHWNEIRANRWPLPFQSAEERAELRKFVDEVLRPRLTEPERRRLEAAERALRDGFALRYVRTLIDLAERHPVLPGPPTGPRSFDELPAAVREFLAAHAIPRDEPELARAEGRWPDYAAAVTALVRRRGLELPVQLGPSRPAEFDRPVRLAIEKIERFAARRKSPEADVLSRARGRWPDYPEQVRRLADEANVPIPGATLPGPPKAWDKFRRKR